MEIDKFALQDFKNPLTRIFQTEKTEIYGKLREKLTDCVVSEEDKDCVFTAEELHLIQEIFTSFFHVPITENIGSKDAKILLLLIFIVDFHFCTAELASAFICPMNIAIEKEYKKNEILANEYLKSIDTQSGVKLSYKSFFRELKRIYKPFRDCILLNYIEGFNGNLLQNSIESDTVEQFVQKCLDNKVDISEASKIVSILMGIDDSDSLENLYNDESCSDMSFFEGYNLAQKLSEGHFELWLEGFKTQVYERQTMFDNYQGLVKSIENFSTFLSKFKEEPIDSDELINLNMKDANEVINALFLIQASETCLLLQRHDFVMSHNPSYCYVTETEPLLENEFVQFVKAEYDKKAVQDEEGCEASNCNVQPVEVESAETEWDSEKPGHEVAGVSNNQWANGCVELDDKYYGRGSLKRPNVIYDPNEINAICELVETLLDNSKEGISNFKYYFFGEGEKAGDGTIKIKKMGGAKFSYLIKVFYCGSVTGDDICIVRNMESGVWEKLENITGNNTLVKYDAGKCSKGFKEDVLKIKNIICKK